MDKELYRYKLNELDNLILFKKNDAKEIISINKALRTDSTNRIIRYYDLYHSYHYERVKVKDTFDYIMEVRKKLVNYYVMFQEEYFPFKLIDAEDVTHLYNDWYKETTNFLKDHKDIFGEDFKDEEPNLLLAVHKYKERRQIAINKIAYKEAIKEIMEENQDMVDSQIHILK